MNWFVVDSVPDIKDVNTVNWQGLDGTSIVLSTMEQRLPVFYRPSPDIGIHEAEEGLVCIRCL